jgi:diguanylate cyclase (GGDEF)-like protein/PAS domain S-box-containing protein
MVRLATSLQVRLTLLVVLGLIGSLWSLALIVDHYQEQKLTALLAAQQSATAAYVAADVDTKIRLRIAGLNRTVDGFPVEILEQPDRLAAFLEDRRAIYNLFDLGLIVVKPDLSGAFGDFPPLPGRRTSSFLLSPFQEVAATAAPAIGPPRLGRFSNKPVVVMAVPIKAADGAVRALLAGVATLDAANFLDSITRPYEGKGDIMVVAPRHDMIVIGTSPAQTLKPLPRPGEDRLHDRFMAGYEGSGVGVNAEGVEELASAKRIPSAGWLAIARLPTADALAPVHELRSLVFGGSMLLSLLVGAVAIVIVRRALRPLADAARTFDAISLGRMPLRALPVTGDDEIGCLAESFNRMQARISIETEALRQCSEAIALVDENLNFRYVNPAFEHLFGYALSELEGRSVALLVPKPEAATDIVEKPIAETFQGERIRCAKDGRRISVLLNIAPLRDADGKAAGFVGTMFDLTPVKAAEAALKESESRYRRLINDSPLGVLITQNGLVRFVNPALLAMFGYREEEVVDHPFLPHVFEEDRAMVADIHQRRMRGETVPDNYVCRVVVRSGEVRYWRLAVRTIDWNGPTGHAVVSDITELKQAEERLERAAHFDALTGIPNRVLLADRMRQALAQCSRTGKTMAVCYLDLDGFKPINDNWGHEAGDQLLKEMARRLTACLRAGDTVARLGGDEFVMLLLNLDRIEECEGALLRVLTAIAQPMAIAGQHVTVTASIGVSLYPSDAGDTDMLLRHADQAMYMAKEAGRNRYYLFDPFRDLRDSPSH